jgi:hypothetical protein
VLQHPTRVPHERPMGAAGRGLVAGVAATLLLSALARVLPGMSNQPDGASKGGQGKPPPPANPFDRQQVSQWQRQAQSPAAHQQQKQGGEGQGGGNGGSGGSGGGGGQGGGAAQVTPAGALAQAQAPGPEGLAAQFAHKLLSGLFGYDISGYEQLAGEAVHFTYGGSWGVLFGLLQSSYRRPPVRFGALYGLIVWLVGPALLVPAMRLLPPPTKDRPARLATMVGGHLVYGLAVAAAFEALEREAE